MHRRRYRFLVPLLGMLPLALGAQYSRPSGSFTLDRIPERTATQIRGELRSRAPNWDRVLRLFFGADGYDRGVPDLVVYIPRAGGAKLALVHEGRRVENLDGQRFLYFVIFSEREIPASAAAGPHLEISVRSIETQDDPFLTALVKSLASRQGASTSEPELASGKDAVLELPLRDMRADTSSADRLDVAMGRVRLGSNDLNRVTITGLSGFSLAPHVSLHYMFGNSDGSLFGASIGSGFTLNVHRPVIEGGAVTGTEGYLRSSFYIFGQVYLDRPHLPRDRFSLGVTVGTNVVQGDLLNDLVVGVSVGRVAGLGAIVGANSLAWREPVEGTDRIRDTRRWRAFVGLDFRL